MPNWCSNVVTFSHPEPKQIARLVKTAESDDVSVLQEFVPCPKELLNDELTTSYADEEKQRQVDALKQQMLDKYGCSSWYDWCIANWGTKWDICDVSVDQTAEDTVQLTFNTAWSPPLEAFGAMEEQGWNIYAMYYEPGCVYAGIYADGYDNCYQNWGDYQDARATLPQELDEMFGISEAQEEWERENEDEVTHWYKDGVAETGLEPHNPPKEI